MDNNTPHIAVRFPDAISAWIRHLHDTTGLTYRQISGKPYFSKLPPGTICAIGKGYSVPNKYCTAMGLPLIVKVPANMVRSHAPQPPRNISRATFYRGTPMDKIISDLAALGHHVMPRVAKWSIRDGAIRVRQSVYVSAMFKCG